MAEQKGEETILHSIRFVDSATRSVQFSHLEGNLMRILEFSKAVILFCPDYGAKNTAILLMKYIFSNLNSLTNQFVRETLPKFKEYVYFHLDLIRKEEMVSLLPAILSSLIALIRSLQTSIKPIVANIEPVIYPLLDNVNPSVRQQAAMLFSALTRCEKSDEGWKKTLSLTLHSLTHTLAEITGTLDPTLDSLPRLGLPSMASFGRITPFIAYARFTTLLQLLQSLLRYPPRVVSFPLLSVVTTLQSLLDAYVPPARRTEEAAAVSLALSPREQWIVFQLVYPCVCETLTLLITRLQSSILIVIQSLTRCLQLFFIRCYKETDVTLSIAILEVIEHLIEVGGPSVIPLLSDVTGILIQILRSMNRAQDDVKITPGQGGKKGGKKNRRRVAVMQLGHEEEVKNVEEFVWTHHMRVNDLYASVVKCVSVILQNGRWLDLNTRLEIDLELFLGLSHLLHPSPVHRTHLPVTTCPQLREVLLEAANIACTSCLPSGQLSPLVSLMPMINQAVVMCEQTESVSRRQHQLMNSLGLLSHAPAQMIFRAMENVTMIRVNKEEKEEKEKEEEVETVTPDPWLLTQAMKTVNPFVRNVEEVTARSHSVKRTEPSMKESTDKETAMISTTSPSVPTITASSSLDATSQSQQTGVSVASSITPSLSTSTTPFQSIPTTETPSLPVSKSKNPTEDDVTTVPVVTGDPETKKRKVDDEISKLRKMSQDYVESERKRSMEMQSKETPTTPQDSDGFAFSDDDDEFDVPDIDI